MGGLGKLLSDLVGDTAASIIAIILCIWFLYSEREKIRNWYDMEPMDKFYTFMIVFAMILLLVLFWM